MVPTLPLMRPVVHGLSLTAAAVARASLGVHEPDVCLHIAGHVPPIGGAAAGAAAMGAGKRDDRAGGCTSSTRAAAHTAAIESPRATAHEIVAIDRDYSTPSLLAHTLPAHAGGLEARWRDILADEYGVAALASPQVQRHARAQGIRWRHHAVLVVPEYHCCSRRVIRR